MRIQTLCLLASLWMAAGPACAAQTQNGLTYREGERVVPIYLDSDTVGQVEGQAVRFVPVPSAEAKAALQKGTMPASLQGQYVPVFRAAANGGARFASAGGVIVYLPATWTQPQVQAWVTAQGLQLQQVFDATRNGLLVQSAPGLPSLDLANRLLKLPDVQTAKPLWYRETTAR